MNKTKKFVTCDGNYAAAHIAYMFSEVAAIYPITPSSTMAEYVDEWAAYGRKNIFGEEVKVVEMQSEAGAAGAVHGSLQAGALTTTFTASQGLLLMIPNMYKIAGELLPCVFHVSARALASHALSIFGDHQDVMAARQTGFAMLATSSVQEVMDLSAVAHLAAIKSRVPFMHFFDGFRTSHEIQKIESVEMDDIKGLIDLEALDAFRNNSLNPEHSVTKGTAQNPDVYFQAREACNKFYDDVPDVVNEYMKELSKVTGRDYHPFDYYGDENAENIIIAMGSVCETTREAVDFLRAKGEKVGLMIVHLYRPFSTKYFMEALPKSVKRIAVLDRTKEAGTSGEPLYLDIRNTLYELGDSAPMVISGRYGLSSKDTTPIQILSVFENLAAKAPKKMFTIGIVDDVTMLSLPKKEEISIVPEGMYEAKFFGLGSDGTVGANKNTIKIIGDETDKYVQAYFAYDSKKSGGFTCSHLRFGDSVIRSTYLVNTPDFVACHVPSYLNQYDLLRGLKKGGSFLLNSPWSIEETKNRLPISMKRYLAENNISFYIIDGTKIASEIGLGNRTNTIMQSAFFKISEILPYEKAVDLMKKFAYKSYHKKGEALVNLNYAAIDRGGEVVKVEIPKEWATLNEASCGCSGCSCGSESNVPDFIKNVVIPMNGQIGDDLPVSTFVGREDGTFPAGTAKYEKRGIAAKVPTWISANCIQCNQCSFVCPHAAIRPFLLTEDEVKNAPAGTDVIKVNGKGLEGLSFRIQVSPLDCTGCGNCANVCPAKEKALVLKPLESQMTQTETWTYMDEVVGYKDQYFDKFATVKNSQFAQPLFEFSGACAGCGETPYIKAITQLFGERMIIANATGCSSIYGGSAPSTPYCKNNKSGNGPAWGNSLFEDNAEYGLGIACGSEHMRERLARLMTEAQTCDCCSTELKAIFMEWVAGMNDATISKEVSDRMLPLVEKCGCDTCKNIYGLRQYLVKKSHWIFGGDGWAYDIGFGGLDHVLASNKDVNVLVVDTEVYSNTGGQASKSTPTSAVAKFAANGKRVRKKDLGMIAMSYGYVYVAQVSMGSNQAQYFKAIKEAEAYPGPSLIIAYSPCINHGLKAGMGKSQEEAKRAVESGYWQLYRYDPRLEEAGKNPFQLDSKEPDWSKFQEFLAGETRYTSLKNEFPSEAQALFEACEDDAKRRYNGYKRLNDTQF